MRTDTSQRLAGHTSGEQSSHSEPGTGTRGKVPCQPFPSITYKLVISLSAVTRRLNGWPPNNTRNSKPPSVPPEFLHRVAPAWQAALVKSRETLTVDAHHRRRSHPSCRSPPMRSCGMLASESWEA